MQENAKQGNGSKGTTPNTKKDFVMERLLADQKIVQSNSKKDIRKASVLLEFNGEPIIRQNTLTIIKGKSGVHKSRVAQMICSILITDDATRRAAIGFKTEASEPIFVTYVDTERNLTDQFPEAIQSIKKQAGYKFDQDVAHFTEFTLINIGRTKRLEAIKKVIHAAKAKVGAQGHMVIVLDVISDCIMDFNDITQTYQLTDELAVFMNRRDVSFIGVIHENPDATRSTKARGHLGTETNNKASAVIQISMIGRRSNKFSINIEKSRSSKVPEPVYIEYNEKYNSLIVTNKPEQTLDETTKKILDYLSEMEGKEISIIDLVKETGISRTTLDNKLLEIIDKGMEVSINGVPHNIATRKDGKKLIAYLIQLSVEEEPE